MSDQSSDRSGPWGGGRSAVSNLRIREAVQDDIAELARLITELGYPTSPTEMRGRLHAIRSDPDYHTLVAQAENGLAGLVGVRLGRHYEKNEPFAQIAALVVGQAHRGTGVGALLLRAAELWATSRGVQEVWVNSHQRRREAHQFYEAHGYERTGFRYRKGLEPAA